MVKFIPTGDQKHNLAHRGLQYIFIFFETRLLAIKNNNSSIIINILKLYIITYIIIT